MNLNSDFVFRGPKVSIYMSADGTEDILLDNLTGDPLLKGSRADVQIKYDEINGFGKEV